MGPGPSELLLSVVPLSSNGWGSRAPAKHVIIQNEQLQFVQISPSWCGSSLAPSLRKEDVGTESSSRVIPMPLIAARDQHSVENFGPVWH